MNYKTKGIISEAIVKHYYEINGCEVLESNYRYKRAEIDIIALSNSELLIFIEVKHRSRKDFGEAETFVSEAQQKRIKEAAEDYIFGINWQKNIRFDIVCVGPKGELEIFEDAF